METGIVVDEGVPENDVRRAMSLIDDSNDVDVTTGTFLTSAYGGVYEDYLGAVHELARDRGWDRTIYVTDQPLVGPDNPELYRVQDGGALVVISASALGLVRVRRRLARILKQFLNTEDYQEANRAHVLRLFAGLVRANQPGRLLPVLTGALVAIAATGGFGIFYGSIWSLATSISWGRLAGISLVGVVVLTINLILSNQLWQRPAHRAPRWLGRLDNVVTLTTVFLTVVALFILAMIGLTAMTAVVVPPDYLAEQISASSVGFATYARVGIFSTALGVLAGAIASNFDRSPKIRSATYNPRENARRLREGTYQKDDDN